MTREEAIARLKAIPKEGKVDIEWEHQVADGVLCDLLVEIGYRDVVEEWKKVPKW